MLLRVCLNQLIAGANVAGSAEPKVVVHGEIKPAA
jgi:hypothetical protein